MIYFVTIYFSSPICIYFSFISWGSAMLRTTRNVFFMSLCALSFLDATLGAPGQLATIPCASLSASIAFSRFPSSPLRRLPPHFRLGSIHYISQMISLDSDYRLHWCFSASHAMPLRYYSPILKRDALSAKAWLTEWHFKFLMLLQPALFPRSHARRERVAASRPTIKARQNYHMRPTWLTIYLTLHSHCR